MVQPVKFVVFYAYKEEYGEKTQNTSPGNFRQNVKKCIEFDINQHDPNIK